jgi:hypothetical protein
VAAGRTLTVNLVANTKSFGRGMMSAVKNAEGFRGKVGAVATSLKRVLGPALLAAGAAAGALAVKMGVDGVKAAMSNERTASALAKTLENLGKAHEAAGVERFVAQLESSTGIVDDELRPALGRLLIATGDVSQAQELLTKSLDVAVGTGKEFTGVVDAIAKAVQTGTAGQLSRYGVIMDDNTLKTEGFTSALNGALDSFQGLQQAEARTLEGQLRILKVEADNVKEAFGRGLLNAFTDSRGGIDDMSQSLRELQDAAEQVGESLGNLIRVGSEVTSWIKTFTGNAGEAGGETAWWQSALGGLISTAESAMRGPFGQLVDTVWAIAESNIAARDATNKYANAADRAKQQNLDFAESLAKTAEEADELTASLENLEGWISRTQTVMAYEAAWDSLRRIYQGKWQRVRLSHRQGPRQYGCTDQGGKGQR